MSASDAATGGSLRILVIVNFPWDPRLGAPRVFMELADEWRAAGHRVERFSFAEAFPGAEVAGVRFAWRQILFTRKAARFVRRNASRFDIIDAITSALPASKRRLRYRGLLVARSVGLPALYEQFEKSIRARWPDARRGTIVGRVLHTGARAWLRNASQRSLKHADVINVPNADEARWLRESGVADARLVVQPYGLTEERRHSFAEAAASPALRLNRRTVSFLGMWSARKGSRDWPAIIRAVRARVPDARFRFLGTMVESDQILRDLQPESTDGTELISNFEPADLPKLLSDCAVGAFPSYVEGFGLAVLEQLAAGVPTVAYDIAGPRDIAGKRLPELLVPCGDADALAAALTRVLENNETRYEQLSRASVATAAEFSWQRIAASTLAQYSRHVTRPPRGAVLLVQPFGLASAGGGARILRALVDGATMPWHSVCSSPERPPRVPNETHLASRPSWGKVEFSRLAFLPQLTSPLFVSSFRRNFRRSCVDNAVRAVHAIPHWGTEFLVAHEVARELGLPFFLQVHDDFEYSSRGHLNASRARDAMHHAWQAADGRFVISKRLGDEYCRRYGVKAYEVVTDGLAQIAAAPSARQAGTLRVYFMGLFHLDYEPNLRALITALQTLRTRHRDATISLTLRCGYVRPALRKLAPDLVNVMSFGSEHDVARDLENADLLYLPLPFDEQSAPFVRFSLSTKMITYIGSGIPILYHGPNDSAVHELLAAHHATISHTSLDVPPLVDHLSAIISAPEQANQVAENALRLARAEFRLQDQQRIFWGRIAEHLAPTEPARVASPLVPA